MDTTTTLVAIAIIALLAFYLYNRGKPAPRGTYNDKNVRSGGSIGGGTRAHDDPNVRSSGSIGGGERSHDSSDVRSGGSIGGRQQSENTQIPAKPKPHIQTNTQPSNRVSTSENHSSLPPLHERSESGGSSLENGIQSTGNQEVHEEPTKQKDEFRSGGSFGGSRK